MWGPGLARQNVSTCSGGCSRPLGPPLASLLPSGSGWVEVRGWGLCPRACLLDCPGSSSGARPGPGCRQPPADPRDPVCVLPLKCHPAGGGGSTVWSPPALHLPRLGRSVCGAPAARGSRPWPHRCALVCCSENEALWREVASLRQKHAQQQKVVNKVRGGPAGHPLGPGPGQADGASPPTAHPVPHLAGAVQPDPGGEEKDVRRQGCPSLCTGAWVPLGPRHS